MGVSCLTEIFYLITVYLTIGTAGRSLPLYQAFDSPSSLTTVSVNATDPATTESCTSSLMWTGRTVYDTVFSEDCFQAWRIFLSTDYTNYRTKEFEFVQQGITPFQSHVPKMATPRRYIKSGSLAHLDDKIMPLTRPDQDHAQLQSPTL